MSQQALDSLVPKPPDKKDNKNQEAPKELGNPVYYMYMVQYFTCALKHVHPILFIKLRSLKTE